MHTSIGSYDTLTRPAPELLASSMVAASGSNPLGQAHTNSKLNLAASLIHEWTMLLPSPTYTTYTSTCSGSLHQNHPVGEVNKAVPQQIGTCHQFAC